MDERLHIFGIRHHGPGSAALLRRALDALNPACVLIEGTPEADDLIPFAGASGMKPPVALLVHASSDANAAFFSTLLRSFSVSASNIVQTFGVRSYPA